ncbi:MAG: glycoside hydrolase family 25 protein [Eubacterium sp.]|nr:glycoside hydrolase family 25 protein [Eubacterium sp.]
MDRIRRIRKVWLFVGGLIAGLLIGVLVKVMMHHNPGLPIQTSKIVSKNIYFNVDKIEGLGEEFPDMNSFVHENIRKYLNKAYVVIGDYLDPNCEFFKISPNVARNDIDWGTEFYNAENELYFRRFKDGQPIGKIGIDVSEFQKNIDWERVKGAGVEVAIVRVGYRGYGESAKMVEDSMMDANLNGANSVGIETGVYFFSSAINRDEGVEEAQFVLDRIGGYNITQPIIIDTERIGEGSGARADEISVEDRTAAVVGFCETIEAAGYTPMIYASRDQFVKYLDIEKIGKWEFWLAAYDTPVFPYHTEAYQYTPYGLVDGIEGNVDLDVWMR